MKNIEITQTKENDEELEFNVVISDNNKTEHVVTLSKKYWEQMTEKKIEPKELIKQSFEFLLARESKESILRSFDLSLIQHYFPEYESSVGQKTAKS